MTTCCHEESSFSVSRRKLTLKGSLLPQSDLSKAVILYQPHSKKPNFGRNLAGERFKQQPTPHYGKQSKQEVPADSTNIQESNDSDVPTKVLSYSLMTALFLATVIIVSYPTQTQDEECENMFPDFNLKLLNSEFNSQLYGQPLAANTILTVLQELQVTVQQVAVLILLGGTGTGKTWTIQLLKNTFSKDANIVHLHLGPWSKNEEVNRAFNDVNKCCQSNFLIVEDSDYASHQQIENVKHLIFNLSRNGSCSNRKIVTVLTSNHGQKELAELLLYERERSGSRWTISKSSVDEILNGLNSPLLDALNSLEIPYNLVPYLPIEKPQIEQCILRYFLAKQKSSPSPDVVQKITQHLRFLPPIKEYFAATGCKTVNALVNLYS